MNSLASFKTAVAVGIGVAVGNLLSSVILFVINFLLSN